MKARRERPRWLIGNWATAGGAGIADQPSSLREPLVVWAVFVGTAIATVVTYARLPPDELWNVSGSGLEGGLSRALVHLNFPVSLAAIAIVLVATSRLTRRAEPVAALAIGLCLVTVIPGVVRADDLDARWVNIFPALGVALALGLTLAGLRRGGLGEPAGRRRLDVVRLVVGLALVFLSLPWLAGLTGFYLDGPYFSSTVVPEPGHPNLTAVHLGLHHGLDGALLAVTALVLSRVTGQLEPGPRRSWLAVYLSLMLVYGLANVANDAWHEQLYKRGWVSTKLPDVTVPEWNAGWGGVLIASAALATVVLYRLGRGEDGAPPSTRLSV